jgi:hypothetical protein
MEFAVSQAVRRCEAAFQAEAIHGLLRQKSARNDEDLGNGGALL